MRSLHRSRRKLISSVAVLLAVLVLAVIAQLRRNNMVERHVEVKHTKQPRAVFGGPEDRTGALSRDNVENSDEGVRGRHPDEGRPSPTEPPAGMQRGTVQAGVIGDVPPDIRAFLERWRTSLLKGDLDTQSSLYAPTVERFFLRRDVTRDFVRREKAAMLKKYPNFEQYDLRDIKVDRVNDDRAIVTFRKDWEAWGNRRFSGSELQRLTLDKNADAWQILREEELKVFRVRR